MLKRGISLSVLDGLLCQYLLYSVYLLSTYLGANQPTYLQVCTYLKIYLGTTYLVVLRYLGRVKCQVVVPPRQQPAAAADGRYFVPLHFQFVYLFLLVLSVSLCCTMYTHSHTHTTQPPTYSLTNLTLIRQGERDSQQFRVVEPLASFPCFLFPLF